MKRIKMRKDEFFGLGTGCGSWCGGKPVFFGSEIKGFPVGTVFEYTDFGGTITLKVTRKTSSYTRFRTITTYNSGAEEVVEYEVV